MMTRRPVLQTTLFLLVLCMLSACQVTSRKVAMVTNTPPWAHSSDRLVVAHYFNWFQTRDVSGNWRNWEWLGNGPKHSPDNVLANDRRDICSVFYPMIGPYDSSRPEVMEYHILTALAAKIDGFFIDWYGIPSVEEQLFTPLLDMADRFGFKMCICFEDKAMFGYNYSVKTRDEAVQNAITNLRYILEKHAQKPSYLRIDGKPVVINFNWHEPMDSVRPHAHGFSAAEWERILAEVRKTSDIYFVHDYHCNRKEQYWDVSDNMYPWLDVNGECLDQFLAEVQRRRADGRIEFVTTLAYPGFDNTGVWGWGDGPYVTPREDGAFYERSLGLAMSNDVRFLQIATWNDFGEGATIEPTLDYGFKYLELTEQYSAGLKGLESDGGKALPIPLTIYRGRVAVNELRARDAEAAKALDAELDAAVEMFRTARFEDAAAKANDVVERSK
jgi:hypothetical protein